MHTMTTFFLITTVIAVGGTLAAMTRRNPIHCILSLALGLVGIAGMYLALGAQFVGFTQILVYVGAVAILAVFALMMTQGHIESALVEPRRAFSRSSLSGFVTAAAVFAVLAWAAHSYHPVTPSTEQTPSAAAKDVGVALMHGFVLPLEVIGVLLTAALIGAVIIALPAKEERP
jgi:NADH-quinone oxidoreductase subunit J